jgi:hypothetical protein
VGAERFPARGQPPVLQEPVHIDVGEQWARGSLNAKDNFRFERTIMGWRERRVVDLRRKG